MLAVHAGLIRVVEQFFEFFAEPIGQISSVAHVIAPMIAGIPAGAAILA
jgi:hypothetical protein